MGRLPEWQVLGSSAGPSVQTRKGTAADVLQIMQGRKLQDDERVSQQRLNEVTGL